MKEERNYVFRGGSWYNATTHAGVAAAYPGRAVVNLGFRLAVDTEANRVGRGGFWYNAAGFARAANRYGYDPVDRSNGLGFRLVADGGE